MFGVLLCNLCYGLKIVVMEKYDTAEYLRLIEWHRVSVVSFRVFSKRQLLIKSSKVDLDLIRKAFCLQKWAFVA